MAEQLFQIGVKGLIRNTAGKVLMVHIPARTSKPDYWDLPGGRMNPDETFLETLARELQEEIGISYTGTPTHFATVQTAIKIPVGTTKVPLILMVYMVTLPTDADITLDPRSSEDAFQWFSPAEAADRLRTKFTADFCQQIAKL